MGQGFAPRSDLVTRQTSGVGSASSPDGPVARPAPAGHWLTPGSSLCHWAKPASAAGWPPCWPFGKPAGYNTSGGDGYAGRVRTIGRSGGTYVVHLNSWVAPKSPSNHVPLRAVWFQRKPAGRKSKRIKPSGRRQLNERIEEDPPPRTPHFQTGGFKAVSGRR